MAGATFAFEAIDLTGIPTKGEIEADSKSQVAEQLRQRGLVVLDVSEKSAPINLEDLLRKYKRVPMRELAIVSRQFATLVSSGMPMLRALSTLEAQTEDDEIKEAIDSVRRDAEGGSPLAQGGGRRWAPGWGRKATSLRPPLPGDGALRRAVRPARGGARPDGDPPREDRHAATRGEIGADVSGPGLRSGDAGDDRNRRLRRPGLHRHLRRTRCRTSRRIDRTAVDDP